MLRIHNFPRMPVRQPRPAITLYIASKHTSGPQSHLPRFRSAVWFWPLTDTINFTANYVYSFPLQSVQQRQRAHGEQGLPLAGASTDPLPEHHFGGQNKPQPCPPATKGDTSDGLSALPLQPARSDSPSAPAVLESQKVSSSNNYKVYLIKLR